MSVAKYPGQSVIRCKLRSTRLGGCKDKFIAASYVWGPAEPSNTILVNQCVFSVRVNLYRFLRALRAQQGSEKLYLWIDAICVDQSSIGERNSQVQQMGNIYSNAKCVYAWLGPDTHDATWLFSQLGTRKIYPGVLLGLNQSSNYHRDPLISQPLSVRMQNGTPADFWCLSPALQAVNTGPAFGLFRSCCSRSRFFFIVVHLRCVMKSCPTGSTLRTFTSISNLSWERGSCPNTIATAGRPRGSFGNPSLRHRPFQEVYRHSYMTLLHRHVPYHRIRSSPC